MKRTRWHIGGIFNSNRRRLLLAFAIAIAIHEILAALIPSRVPDRAAQPEVVSRVTVARILARPSPTPTPSPPPHHVAVRLRVIAPVEARVVAPARAAKNGAPEPIHRIAAARPKPPVVRQTKPVWDLPVGGQGAGAGNRSGAGSLGNGSGNGSGTGEAGAGSGSGGGTHPCGFVTFSHSGEGTLDSQRHSYWVDRVQMSVRYPDGSSDTVMLDYPWYYRDAASNPWSSRNVDNPDFITPFQFPPPSVRGNESALVRYVMAHTGSDGYTSLKPCPS